MLSKRTQLLPDQHSLFEAVKKNNVETAEQLLSTQNVDPNFVVYRTVIINGVKEINQTPLLFCVETPEIMALLLKYHADPYAKQCTYKGDPSHPSIITNDEIDNGPITKKSILQYFNMLMHRDKSGWAFTNTKKIIPLLLALLKSKPFFIPDSICVNASLLSLLMNRSQLWIAFKDREPALYEMTMKVITLLIQRSGDLQKVWDKYYSPFTYIFTCLEDLIPLMLNNNLQLITNLKQISWLDSEKNEKIMELCQQSTLDALCNMYRIWGALSLVSGENRDENSSLSLLPQEILKLIALSLLPNIADKKISPAIDCFIYNIKLAERMQFFSQVYDLLSDAEAYTPHDFVDYHSHFTSVTFFSKARQHAEKKPKGLTAKSLMLTEKYYDSGKTCEAEVVNTIAQHYVVNKGWFANEKETQTQAQEKVRNTLFKRP